MLDGGGVDHGEEFGLRGGGGESEWWRASRWRVAGGVVVEGVEEEFEVATGDL